MTAPGCLSSTQCFLPGTLFQSVDGRGLINAEDLKRDDIMLGVDSIPAVVLRADEMLPRECDLAELSFQCGTLKVTTDHLVVTEGPSGMIPMKAGELVGAGRRVLLASGFETVVVTVLPRITTSVVRVELQDNAVALAKPCPTLSVATFGAQQRASFTGSLTTRNTFVNYPTSEVEKRQASSCPASVCGGDSHERQDQPAIGVDSEACRLGSNCTPCFQWRRTGACLQGDQCTFCHLSHFHETGRPMPRRDNTRRRKRHAGGVEGA